MFKPLERNSVSFKAICVLLTAVFSASILLSDFAKFAWAQGEQALPGLPSLYASTLNLPSPDKLVHLSPQYHPVSLRGIRFYPDDPLRFDFILDKPDAQSPQDGLKGESSQLIKYFLASLTIPEEDLWVNLSPYEEDRVVPRELGLTDMGKDLLREDYILKQLLASLTYPDSPLGKEFWDKVYQKAHQLFGTTKIPINTYNKVWIVPDKAVVYEDKDRAILGESRLKVMLEEDYTAFKNREQIAEGKQAKIKLTENETKDINNFSSLIMKEVILPAIEKEVNEGKNFAQLRQIYSALILAVWFKKKLRESIIPEKPETPAASGAGSNQKAEDRKDEPLLSMLYLDKKKIKGVDSDDPKVREKVYQLYVEAYKKGLYNYIKSDFDPFERRQIKRRYYSGGANLTTVSSAITIRPLAAATGLLPGLTLEQLNLRLLPALQKPGEETSASPLKSITIEEIPELKNAKKYDTLASLVRDAELKPDLRTAAIRALGDVKASNTLKTLVPVLEHIVRTEKYPPELRIEAIRALRESGAAYKTLETLAPVLETLVPVLEHIVRTELDSGLREVAIWALGWYVKARDILKTLVPVLEHIVRTEKDSDLRERAIWALGWAEAYDTLVSLVKDTQLELDFRKKAMRELRVDKDRDILVSFVENAKLDSELCKEAIHVLWNARASGIFKTLVPVLAGIVRTELDSELREVAIRALGEAEVRDILVSLVKDTQLKLDLRKKAMRELRAAEAHDTLISFVEDTKLDSELRKEAIRVLRGHSDILETLVPVLEHIVRTELDSGLREVAIRALGDVKASNTLKTLVPVLGKEFNSTTDYDYKVIIVRALSESGVAISSIKNNLLSKLVQYCQNLFNLQIFNEQNFVRLLSSIFSREAAFQETLINFLSSERNRPLLKEKTVLVEELVMINAPEEIFDLIINIKVTRDKILGFFRNLNNILQGTGMTEEDTLADWNIFIDDFIPRFGFLNNRDLILVHRYLLKGRPLESEDLKEYKLQILGVTVTGEEGIKQLEAGYKALKSKIIAERKIDIGSLENPLIEALAGGLTGFYTAQWGHGSYGGRRLKEFCEEFYNGQDTIPPLDPAFNSEDVFLVSKLGERDFTPDAQDKIKQYAQLIQEAVDLSQKPKGEQLKSLKDKANLVLYQKRQKLEDKLKIPDEKAKKGLELQLNRLNSASEAIQKATTLIDLAIAMVSQKELQDLTALVLTAETLGNSEHAIFKQNLLESINSGISNLALNHIIELKEIFIKEHTLKDVDRNIRKSLLNSLSIRIFEEELKMTNLAKETIEVKSFATNGILGELAGSIGDACYTRESNIMQRPIIPVIFQVGEGLDAQFIGSMLILENTIGGKPVFILRAINPSQIFLSEYSAESFLRGAIGYIEKIAKAKGVDILVAPIGDAGALSNRGEIDDAIGKFTKGKRLVLDKEESFNDYDITKGIVEQVSSSLSVDPPDGLCLTPDSLISLADGATKPLIELKKGDYVLSLNEEKGRFEPHRVNALLDMGVKPVYRIATASGKTLKTTLTHPYLTRNGWKKLQEIKVGEEIVVIDELFRPDSDSVSFHNKKSSFKLGWGKFLKQVKGILNNFFLAHIFNINNCYAQGGFDVKTQDIPKIPVKSEQNMLVIQDITENFTIRSGSEMCFKGRDNPKAAFFERSNYITVNALVSKNSHKDNLGLGDYLGGVFHKLRGVFNSGKNIFFGNAGVLFGNFFYGVASAQQIEDITYRNAGSFDAGLAKPDFRINHDSFMHNLNTSSIKDTTLSYSRQDTIFFEPITKIEYLGELPVYDIEVEGTHNFVAQGIVAHNTYTQETGEKTASSAVENSWGEIEYFIEHFNQVHGGDIIKYIQELSSHKERIRILDLGSGGSANLMQAIKKVFPESDRDRIEVYAIDKKKRGEVIPGVNFIQGDVNEKLRELSEKDENFDVIVSTGALMYFDNPIEVLKLTEKMLTKDGFASLHMLPELAYDTKIKEMREFIQSSRKMQYKEIYFQTTGPEDEPIIQKAGIFYIDNQKNNQAGQKSSTSSAMEDKKGGSPQIEPPEVLEGLIKRFKVRDFMRGYLELTPEEKINLREAFQGVFKAQPSSVFMTDSVYPLTSEKMMQELLNAAKELVIKYYPNSHRIVSLGRSPLWIIVMASLIDPNPKRYSYVAFSARWYKEKNGVLFLGEEGPNDEQISAYRKYLAKIKLDPFSIINNLEKSGQKTVIVEYTQRGESLMSFLSVLSNWAKELGVEEKLKNSLLIHILQDPNLEKARFLGNFHIDGHQEIDSELIVGLANSDTFNDSMGEYFPYSEWTKKIPMSLGDGISSNAALVLFRIVDFLAQKGMIEYNSRAGRASSALEDKKGGIDLNPANLNMEVRGEGVTRLPSLMNVPFDIQNFQGFTFQILSIQPVEGWETAFGLPSPETENLVS